MNTVWTFGDSFTFGYGCRKDCNSYTLDEYYSYKKNNDDIWPNHLDFAHFIYNKINKKTL